MTVDIRPCTDADRDEVIALWCQVFPDAPVWNQPEADFARKLDVQRELFLVARAGAALVGTAMAGYDGHRGWVYYLAVHPDYRRHGIGAALMHRVEQDLAALGCPKLNLQARASNQAVVAFYEKMGYQAEQRVSMGKRLDNHNKGD